MSLYEILAVVALLAAGGFAYRLYRKDTRPGAPPPPPGSGESMFRRDKNTPSS
jgi:hypothetical protein